ncbi:TetR family transcriptional regulator [Nocardia sp. NPDC055029]
MATVSQSGAPHQMELATDDPTAARILHTAIEVIAARGYHGTSVRDIAQAAGISAGSIYNYFGSKQGLLDAIMNQGMDALIAGTEQALYEAPTDPVARLDAIVAAHVRAHAGARAGSYIGNAELRSLEPPALAVVVAKRDTQQRMFDRVLADGARQGVFTTSDPKLTAKFIVTACTAVASWYRAEGPVGVDQLVEQYQAISRAAAGFRSD